MSKKTEEQPDLLLLDFGGVLLRLNDPVATFGIGSAREDFNRIWLTCPAVLEYESGRIDLRTFAERVVATLALPYSLEEFIARFDAWPGTIPEDTPTLLQAVPAGIECAILSNTNALHWAQQNIADDLDGRIARTFLSFETGLVKPDERAFRHVLDETGYAAPNVLFLDDNPLNIEAAARVGMRARLCPGVDALGEVLRSAGIL